LVTVRFKVSVIFVCCEFKDDQSKRLTGWQRWLHQMVCLWFFFIVSIRRHQFCH